LTWCQDFCRFRKRQEDPGKTKAIWKTIIELWNYFESGVNIALKNIPSNPFERIFIGRCILEYFNGNFSETFRRAKLNCFAKY
jgi:hypothetical protein